MDFLNTILTLKRVGVGGVGTYGSLAHLCYLSTKLLIKRAQVEIVNSPISVAVVLTPFSGPVAVGRHHIEKDFKIEFV